MMRIVLGCLIGGVALYALATAIVPSWRRTTFWRGTRVRCGPVACAGFGIALGVGATFLLADEFLGDAKPWLLLTLAVGIALVFIGNFKDFRRTPTDEK